MEMIFDAKIDELNNVLQFIDEMLEKNDSPMKVMMQMDVAVEEIFVNIANYAYSDGTGKAYIEANINSEGIEVIFKDKGIPFNPLEAADPDITASVEERKIGGLGIFMVKKSMDEMSYEYLNGENVLRIFKKL